MEEAELYSDEMHAEILCYKNGTYTMPWVEGFTPYGGHAGCLLNLCNGCGEKKPPTWWITHNVNRSYMNPDKHGNYGDYTQVSHYCDTCQPIFDKLAKQIHQKPVKQHFCTIA